MTIFKLNAYPCTPLPSGIVQITITGCFARTTVDCSIADLAAKMQTFAEAEGGKTPGAVYVSATPEGRAPNGWNKAKAAKQNELVFEKTAPAAQVAA